MSNHQEEKNELKIEKNKYEDQRGKTPPYPISIAMHNPVNAPFFIQQKFPVPFSPLIAMGYPFWANMQSYLNPSGYINSQKSCKQIF